jgi:hypothetical protein
MNNELYRKHVNTVIGPEPDNPEYSDSVVLTTENNGFMVWLEESINRSPISHQLITIQPTTGT